MQFNIREYVLASAAVLAQLCSWSLTTKSLCVWEIDKHSCLQKSTSQGNDKSFSKTFLIIIVSLKCTFAHHRHHCEHNAKMICGMWVYAFACTGGNSVTWPGGDEECLQRMTKWRRSFWWHAEEILKILKCLSLPFVCRCVELVVKLRQSSPFNMSD